MIHVFNEDANLLTLVNVTIVHYNDAAGTRVRVGERNLCKNKLIKTFRMIKDIPHVHAKISKSAGHQLGL